MGAITWLHIVASSRWSEAGRLIVEQSKSQRGLLVRLCENRRRRLLEDLIPDESGRVLGHIRVGDASLGGLRHIGNRRCDVRGDLKATDAVPIVPETLLTLSR